MSTDYPLAPRFRPGNDDNNGGKRTVRPPSNPKSSERRLTTAAEGELIPHIYGKVQTGGKIFAVGYDNQYWYIGILWCIGGTRGIKEIEKVFNGDIEIPASERQDFLGKPYQDTYVGYVGGEEEFGVTALNKNWLNQVKTDYNDNMVAYINNLNVGVAYSVVRIPLGKDINNLFAQVNGFLVKDYSSTNVPDTTKIVAEPLQLENDWINYDETFYNKARYFKLDDGSIFVQGLVRNGINGNALISSINNEINSGFHRVFSVYTNDEPARVDVRSDGSIVSPWDAANGVFNTWGSIAFNFYPINYGWTDLEPLNGWTNYNPDSGYPPLSYKVLDDGRVYIRGLVNIGTIGVPIANLPESIVPSNALIFSCRTQGDSDARIDIAGTAIIARNGSGWVAVEICYCYDDDGWTDLPLLGNWHNYGGSYQTAQYKLLSSGVVYVRGLVQNSAYEANIAQLPSGYRPSGTLLTCKIDGDGVGKRIDYKYNDGIIYSTASLNTNYLSINQCFIPSSEMWEYVESTNPSNALADHIESKAYGVGGKIGNVQMLTAAADYNNEDVYGTIRHQIGYSIVSPDDVIKHIETLRDYASCFVDYLGDYVYIIPDKKIDGSGSSGELIPNDFVGVFDESNIINNTLKIKKDGDRNRPTVVSVTYNEREDINDNGINIWSDGSVVKYFNDDVKSVVHWKESRLSYTGIPNKSQATRKAIEYMNHIWLEDLQIEFITFGDAISVYNGSLILVKAEGIGTDIQSINEYKPFRVQSKSEIGLNKYKIKALEYQDDSYSDVIDITPSIPDTKLPDITEPAVITDLIITELSNKRGNNFYTYFRVEIVTEDGIPADIQGFEWIVYMQGVKPDDGSLFSDGFEGLVENARGVCGSEKQFLSAALNSNTTYVINVLSKNTAFNTVSDDWFSVTIKAIGHDDPPSIPFNFQGYEAGGNIRLMWESATDEFEVPLYEIRYLYDNVEEPLGDWGAATMFAKVSANFVNKPGQIEGYYKFFIKSIDVFGTYSTEYSEISVKSDSDDKFFIDNDWDYELTWLDQDVDLYRPFRAKPDVYGFTICATAFGTLFTTPLSNFDYPIHRYYPTGYSFKTNRVGLGVDDGNMATLNPITFPTPLHGEFSSLVEEFLAAPIRYTDGSFAASTGAFTHQVYNPDSGYEYHSGIRAKFSTYASSISGYAEGNNFVLRVDNAKLVGYFATRKEEGEVTTTAGSVGNEIVSETINLTGHYYKVYDISLTIVGNPGQTDVVGADVVAEDIVVNPSTAVQNKFDLYVTNKFTGESVARTVRWKFEGV
jgi:hypothetical protein